MRVGVLLGVVFALASFPKVGLADDYGPHRALREIRGALPVLLATATSWLPRNPGIPDRPSADDIVVKDIDAVATWHTGKSRGLLVLRRRSGLWWITGSAYRRGDSINSWQIFPPGTELPCLDPVYTVAMTVRVLQLRLAVPSDLAQIVRDHVSDVATATDLETRHDSRTADARISESCYSPVTTQYEINTDADYVALLSEHLPENITMLGRAPTEGEMPPTRGANSYYFFSMSNAGQTPVQFVGGTKLAVWCPFVLDPSLRYSVTIAGSDPTVGPVDGTLRDNVLHFDLPAFAAKPGVELMGEIEGDPRI